MVHVFQVGLHLSGGKVSNSSRNVLRALEASGGFMGITHTHTHAINEGYFPSSEKDTWLQRTGGKSGKLCGWGSYRPGLKVQKGPK